MKPNAETIRPLVASQHRRSFERARSGRGANWRKIIGATRAALLTVAALFAWASGSAAVQADPTRTPSLEETLFEKPRARHGAPAKKDGGRSPHFAPSRITRQSFWAEELLMTNVSGQVMPLDSVAQRMRDVQDMIGRAECGTATQQAQREILDSLDYLLEQVAQCKPGACKSSGQGQQAGAGSQSGKPGEGNTSGPDQGASRRNIGRDDPGLPPRPADDPRKDAARRRAMLKRLWGELPPRQREQMLQMPMEEFLPQYELMIEEYFRRLSKERTNRPASRQPTTPSP